MSYFLWHHYLENRVVCFFESKDDIWIVWKELAWISLSCLATWLITGSVVLVKLALWREFLEQCSQERSDLLSTKACNVFTKKLYSSFKQGGPYACCYSPTSVFSYIFAVSRLQQTREMRAVLKMLVGPRLYGCIECTVRSKLVFIHFGFFL